MVNTFKETTPELGSYTQRATEQLKKTLSSEHLLVKNLPISPTKKS
jgi:hypothetical protein